MHRKSRCEMLFGGNDISNDVITLGTCLSMFVYIRARFRFSLIGRNLTAESKASHREIGGGIQIPGRDVVASSPSFSRPAGRAPREACSQASAEFIDPSTVFFKVTNEDNFTKICRHRRKERLNIGKRVKFESDASKASMTPPPLPQSTNVCRFLAKLGNVTISLGSLLSFVDGFSLTVGKKRPWKGLFGRS